MKKAIAFFMAACMTVMISGCSSEPTFENKPTSFEEYTTDGKVTKMVGDENLEGELNITVWSKVTDEATSEVSYAIAARRFRELYPNVDLKIEYSTEDLQTFNSQQSTEIMAGGGSDVIITNVFGGDLYKMAMSGNFADMSGYIENDPYLNLADFNQTALASGWIDGGQRLLPTQYLLYGTFMTTQEKAKESGFDESQCTDTISTLKEIKDAATYNHANYNDFISALYAIGMYWVDYENETVDLSDPRLKEVYNLLQDVQNGVYETFAPMGEKEPWYFTTVSGPNDFSSFEFAQNPMLVSIPRLNGGIEATAYEAVAINENCSNKQAAYYFAKILLLQEWSDYERSTDSKVLPSRVVNSIGFPVYTKLLDQWVEMGALPESLQNDLLEHIEGIEHVGYAQCTAYSLMEESLKKYASGNISYENLIAETENKIELALSE